MSAFDGAHEHWCRDRDLLIITGAVTEPRRRRRHHGQAIAKWVVAAAIATAAAWFLSEVATAALLDEARLAAMGIRP